MLAAVLLVDQLGDLRVGAGGVRDGRLVHGDLLVATTLHTLGEILSSQHGQEPELVRVLAAGRRGAAMRINAVDPGFTATDFNQHRGTQTVGEGAEIIVRMASIGPDGPTGGYFSAAGPVPW